MPDRDCRTALFERDGDGDKPTVQDEVQNGEDQQRKDQSKYWMRSIFERSDVRDRKEESGCYPYGDGRCRQIKQKAFGASRALEPPEGDNQAVQSYHHGGCCRTIEENRRKDE